MQYQDCDIAELISNKSEQGADWLQFDDVNRRLYGVPLSEAEFEWCVKGIDSFNTSHFTYDYFNVIVAEQQPEEVVDVDIILKSWRNQIQI